MIKVMRLNREGEQDCKKFLKDLKAGDRREGRKLGKSEVKQEQRQE